MCSKHHRTGKDSYHKLGARRFAEVHNLDIPAVVRRLNLKPVIRIESGSFVGYLDDRQYVLGTTNTGVQTAVRKMVTICGEDRTDRLREKASIRKLGVDAGSRRRGSILSWSGFLLLRRRAVRRPCLFRAEF